MVYRRSIFLILVMVHLGVFTGGCIVRGTKSNKEKHRGKKQKEEVYASLCDRGEGGIDEEEQRKLKKYFLSGNPLYGGVVKVHTDVEPPHLQPMLRPDAWIIRMVHGDVFEPLVARDPYTHRIKGVLAENWQFDEKTNTYIFNLRKGVKFHDGVKFTAKDVVFTLNLLMNPSTAAVTMRSSLEQIDSFQDDGDYRVVIHLSKPHFIFLQNLEGLPILPAHIYSKGNINTNPFNRKPVGTGPFKFKRWISGREISFVRNDDYWGKKPYLGEVRYLIFKDRNVAFQVLRTGGIDLMPRVSTEQYYLYDRDKSLKADFNRIAFTTPDYSFIMMNTKSLFFSNVNVRRAMAMLLDLEKIRESVYKCLVRIVTGPWPVGHPAYDSGVLPYPYSPERASELLDKAGWKDTDGDTVRDKNGKQFKFTFIIPTQSREIQRMATIYQQDLKKVGVKMEISLQDWSVYLDLCKKHKFDMAAMMWDMEWENDLFGLFHSRAIKGGQNFPAWSNPEADRILEVGRITLDPVKRNLMFRRLHRILHEEVPYIFAFSPVETAFVSKKFRGRGLLAGMKWFDKTRIWKEK